MSRPDNTVVVANVLNLIASKEVNYKERIKQNHVFAKNAAKRIRHFEEILTQAAESAMTPEEWQSYLTQQKEDVKNIAKSNVANEREVDAFCKAVRAVQAQVVQRHRAGAASASTENQDEPQDFEQTIQDAIQTAHAQNKAAQLDVEQEPYYRDIAQALGEQVAAPKNRRGVIDDDEIEVTEPLGGAEIASLKCPFTSKYMEDAVRNKVCGHVYSREGIIRHIQSKQRNCTCPIPGCGNGHVTEQQLEEDVETKMNVRRAMRQESLRLEQQKSQASDLMDSDED